MATVTAGLPEGMSEQDWLNLLLGSPLFETVNKIEELVKNGSGDAGVAGAKGGRHYIDIKVGFSYLSILFSIISYSAMFEVRIAQI